jgi:hypothetical protein
MCTSRHSLSSWRQPEAHADLNPAASDTVSRCRAPDKCTGQLCSGTAWTWTQPGAVKADRPSPLSAAEWTPRRGRGSVPRPAPSRRFHVGSGQARLITRPRPPSVIRRPGGHHDATAMSVPGLRLRAQWGHRREDRAPPRSSLWHGGHPKAGSMRALQSHLAAGPVRVAPEMFTMRFCQCNFLGRSILFRRPKGLNRHWGI